MQRRALFAQLPPKDEFKRLICGVIDFDKGIAIIYNQYLTFKSFNSR